MVRNVQLELSLSPVSTPASGSTASTPASGRDSPNIPDHLNKLASCSYATGFAASTPASSVSAALASSHSDSVVTSSTNSFTSSTKATENVGYSPSQHLVVISSSPVSTPAAALLSSCSSPLETESLSQSAATTAQAVFSSPSPLESKSSDVAQVDPIVDVAQVELQQQSQSGTPMSSASVALSTSNSMDTPAPHISQLWRRNTLEVSPIQVSAGAASPSANLSSVDPFTHSLSPLQSAVSAGVQPAVASFTPTITKPVEFVAEMSSSFDSPNQFKAISTQLAESQSQFVPLLAEPTVITTPLSSSQSVPTYTVTTTSPLSSFISTSASPILAGSTSGSTKSSPTHSYVYSHAPPSETVKTISPHIASIAIATKSNTASQSSPPVTTSTAAATGHCVTICSKSHHVFLSCMIV